MTLEDKRQKKIWLLNMSCPQENIEKVTQKKIAFKIRERRPGFAVEVVPVVIGCLGGGMLKTRNGSKSD